eukprot:3447914-Amphidinium_carterae.1
MRLCFAPNGPLSLSLCCLGNRAGSALGHTPSEWFELPCPPPMSDSVVDVQHPTLRVGMSTKSSKAVVLEMAAEVGLQDAFIKKLVEDLKYDTLGKVGYACSFQPGRTDDSKQQQARCENTRGDCTGNPGSLKRACWARRPSTSALRHAGRGGDSAALSGVVIATRNVGR